MFVESSILEYISISELVDAISYTNCVGSCRMLILSLLPGMIIPATGSIYQVPVYAGGDPASVLIRD